MKKLFLFILLIVLASIHVKSAGYYFYVQLTDKNNSPYSISNPEIYLSDRAIERRNYYKVPIDSTDLPVNPEYINEIKDLGIHMHSTTKWLNGITVLVQDSARISTIRTFPFVKFAQFTGITNEHPVVQTPSSKMKSAEINYGTAETQIKLMNGKTLHQHGYLGENIHIAVLDAGFYGVDIFPAFQKMRDENRLIRTKDIVNPFSNIYKEDGHGTSVLSTMATELDGKLVGTAPKASYLLIRTEAATGEYICEPDFWVSGIEYADSVGVDVATTSLGYTKFDDPAMNYTYSELDGKTLRASIAANMAYKKGILLFNSAGNEGATPWKYISSPADAAGVITVGSVTKDSVPSIFSSFGPTSDNRVKPELSTLGSNSAIITMNGSASYNNGTSFSTPILAGMSACFLQAAKIIKPNHTLEELRDFLFQSAHLYNNPTNQMGYGIPNFTTAYQSLVNASHQSPTFENQKTTYKILIKGNEPITLKVPEYQKNKTTEAKLYSISGQLCKNLEISEGIITIVPTNFQAGFYILQFQNQ